MLAFLHLGRSPDPEKFALTEDTRAWLSSVSDADAPAAARALADRLVSLNQAQLQPRLRLRLLDMFSEQVDKLLPVLEQRIYKVRPPLRSDARQAAYLIEKLYKELAVGYTILVLRTPRLWRSPDSKKRMHLPLVRAMDFQARRLALSEQLYAPRPGSVWLALHRLYRLAREWRVDEEESGAARLSPLRIYREALLLAFAHPQQLGPGDCKRVRVYLARYAHLATLRTDDAGADTNAVFLIDTRRDLPGHALTAGDEKKAGLLLHTRHLVETVQTELKQLLHASKIHKQHDAQAPLRIDLLQRLDDNWRGERSPRAARTRFHPRAEVWTGLGDIWRLLLDTGRNARMPRSDSGRWVILNESARGFALKCMATSVPPVSVGEIVALRADGQRKLHVCIVRWIVSNGPEHLEIGLEQLAPIVIPASYKSPSRAHSGASAVLYLPPPTGVQRSALLIAAPALVNTARAVELRHPKGKLALQATRIAETTASVQFIEVVPA